MQIEGVLIMTPEAPLEISDFQKLSEEIYPYIEVHGELHGLLIDAKAFPGWQNFAGLIAHLKFVVNQHKKIQKVAVLSDDSFLSTAPTFADHFVKAEIKHFSHSEMDQALHWLMLATKALS